MVHRATVVVVVVAALLAVVALGRPTTVTRLKAGEVQAMQRQTEAEAATHAAELIERAKGQFASSIAGRDGALAPPVPSLLEASAFRPLHFLITSVPLYGHFLPLKAVGEQLLRRGHRVTLLVEHEPWCATTLPALTGNPSLRFECRVVPGTTVFTKELFRNISAQADYGTGFHALFDAMIRHHEAALPDLLRVARQVHHERPVDYVFNDISTFAGYDVAKALGAQLGHMFPLTLNLSPGMYTHLPPLGTAFGRNMTLGQRLVAYGLRLALPFLGDGIVERLNVARRANKIDGEFDISDFQGRDAVVLAPTVWGYDLAQPVCPNVFPLGVIAPAPDTTPLEPSLKEFLETPYCTERGAVYVNFGTLAVLTPRLFDEVVAGLADRQATDGACVVWKITDADRRHDVERLLREASQLPRFFIAQRFANPREIMAHPSTSAFVTHCGDTSVGEAIEAGVPLVGVPVFADQADVCQRVSEAGIGVYAGPKATVTAADITAGIARVLRREPGAVDGKTSFDRAIAKAQRWSKAYGGAARGAEVIERFALLGPEVTAELTCRHTRPGGLSSHPVLHRLYQCELDWMLVFLVAPILLARWVILAAIQVAARLFRYITAPKEKLD